MKKCSVEGCGRDADVKVINYDVYFSHLGEAEVFFEQDFTCPFLCAIHVQENEFKAEGVREPRGYIKYPYSNKDGAQGFTVYFPLANDKQKKLFALLQEDVDSPATQN